jgi:uncharacterized protein (DUF433 family)
MRYRPQSWWLTSSSRQRRRPTLKLRLVPARANPAGPDRRPAWDQAVRAEFTQIVLCKLFESVLDPCPCWFIGQFRVIMTVMDAKTTQSQAERTEATTGPLRDRVRIVITPGTCGGKPRIDGHRITVKHIVLDHQRGGMSPDEIESAYPSLTLSDVYAALAYYHDHRAAIDAAIKDDDDHWAEIERENPGTLIDRLRQRKANRPDNTLPPG